MVVLPAPLGPRKPNTEPSGTIEVDAVERARRLVDLGEAGDLDGGSPVRGATIAGAYSASAAASARGRASASVSSRVSAAGAGTRPTAR